MILNTDPGALLDAAGALVIAALGAWVLTLRPRSRTTVSLGVFCIAFGGAFAAQNLFAEGFVVEPGGIVLVQAPLLLAAAVAVLTLATSFPRPPDLRQRRWLLAFAAAVALVRPGLTWALGLDAPAWVHAFGVGMSALVAALFGSVAFLALRFASATDAAERSRYARIATALVLWPGYAIGATWFTLDAGAPLNGAVLATLGAGGVLWLRGAQRGRDPRTARNLALLCFALPLAGLVAGAVVGAEPKGGYGAMRLLTTLLLVHAILRHRLLGIDVKVRWTISKSTIAAVFIAVFFIASEAAQQFFGETLGSTYVGILAAGLLVFAIAPLSRLADRVAEKAVPAFPDASPPHRAAVEKEDTYRAMLRRFLVDGVATREEERALANLARDLGIDAARAFEIRTQVLDELTARGHG